MVGRSSPKRSTVPRGSPKLRTIRMGLPKLSRFMAMASAMKNKHSPKSSRSSSVPEQSAYWNPILEKSLAEILYDFKDLRGDNGWSSEVWSRMVVEFHARNQYACYSKKQIQEKEMELKRDYKMLKEDLKNCSGCSWNPTRWMIEASPHQWENLKISFPKIKKFQNLKATFPLLDFLGELYDGQLAEGDYNFTSLEELTQEEPLQQIIEENDIEDVDGEAEQQPLPQKDEEVQVLETSVPRPGQQRRISAAAGKKEENESIKVKRTSNVEGMMERYLDMRAKQIEEESAILEERSNQFKVLIFPSRNVSLFSAQWMSRRRRKSRRMLFSRVLKIVKSLFHLMRLMRK